MKNLCDEENLNKDFFNRPHTCILKLDYTPLTLHKTPNGKFFFYDEHGIDLDNFTINHQKSMLLPAIEKLKANLGKFEEAGYYHFMYNHEEVEYFSFERPTGLYFMYYQDFDDTIKTDFDNELHIQIPVELLINPTTALDKANVLADQGILILFDGTDEIYQIENSHFRDFYNLKNNFPDFGEGIRNLISASFYDVVDENFNKLLEQENNVSEYAAILSLHYLGKVLKETELEITKYNHKLLDYSTLARIQYPNIFNFLYDKGRDIAVPFTSLFGKEAFVSTYSYIFIEVTSKLYEMADPKLKRVLCYEIG